MGILTAEVMPQKMHKVHEALVLLAATKSSILSIVACVAFWRDVV